MLGYFGTTQRLPPCSKIVFSIQNVSLLSAETSSPCAFGGSKSWLLCITVVSKAMTGSLVVDGGLYDTPIEVTWLTGRIFRGDFSFSHVGARDDRPGPVGDLVRVRAFT